MLQAVEAQHALQADRWVTVLVEAYASQRRLPHLRPTPPLRLSSHRSIRDRVERDLFGEFLKHFDNGVQRSMA